MMHVHKKLQTRTLSLVSVECWDRGERVEMRKHFFNFSLVPLFIYTPGRAVSVYYDFTDSEQDMQPMLDYLHAHPEWLEAKKVEFDAWCNELRGLIHARSRNHQLIYELIIKIFPSITVADAFCISEIYAVSKEVMDICVRIRNESDDVLHAALNYLDQIFVEQITLHYPAYQNCAAFITYAEFVNDSIPELSVVQRRMNGYIYHKGEVYLQATDIFMREHDFVFEEAPGAIEHGSLMGKSASRGIASGPAVVIFEMSDLSRVVPGCVLVTSMTTPDMASALHRVAAIVTDEGGVTCHAAIIARELQKPCVIATKHATTMIHEGMYIEVDADRGSVSF